MKPYFYKIQEIVSGKYYVGCQYGKLSDPSNLWETYFTSNQYIKSQPKTNFKIVKLIQRDDARDYERRYLNKCYKLLGKEKFCTIFINRNLAPGIILEGQALENLKISLRNAWKNESRKKRHYEVIEKMKLDGTYEKRRGIDNLTDEAKQNISIRMTNNNPMHSEEIKKKHLLAVNTEKEKQRKKTQSTGNTYTKGKSWYNDGNVCVMAFLSPGDNWVKGRLKPHWNYNRKYDQKNKI